MTLPHTADDLAEHSDELMAKAYEDHAAGNNNRAMLHALDAQRTATLALAGATIESTTPPDDLDLACPATTARELYLHEDAEAGDVHDCVRYRGHTTPHRCRVCAYEWPTEAQEQARDLRVRLAALADRWGKNADDWDAVSTNRERSDAVRGCVTALRSLVDEFAESGQ
jgi:hypothetical protein